MSKINSQSRALVYSDRKGMIYPILMGTLSALLLRGNEIFSFEYNSDWLKKNHAQILDPDLQLYAGQQYLQDEKKSNFGIFLDSSPDRWGRLLMRRREAAIARIEKRQIKSFFEMDYLLGVYDETRMGGLRFKENMEGPFVNDNKKFATPPFAALRDLEFASLQLERNDVVDDPDYMKWLNMLIAPGSSLGGARPKANVTDKKNNLWIAKFPSGNDIKDIGAREMVVNELAVKSGINMSTAIAKKYAGKQHTFLTKRFDRTDKGERIQFASAMTMLGYTDGADEDSGVSYLELVAFISRYGANLKNDLEELWRRIVFSICVSNTDDHLRNHGFLLTDEGWVLSPAFDINPVETGTGLKLNISEEDNSLSLELAMDVSKHFRLTNRKANEIINDVLTSVKNWKPIASKLKISKSEQEQVSHAFRLSETKLFH